MENEYVTQWKYKINFKRTTSLYKNLMYFRNLYFYKSSFYIDSMWYHRIKTEVEFKRPNNLPLFWYLPLLWHWVESFLSLNLSSDKWWGEGSERSCTPTTIIAAEIFNQIFPFSMMIIISNYHHIESQTTILLMFTLYFLFMSPSLFLNLIIDAFGALCNKVIRSQSILLKYFNLSLPSKTECWVVLWFVLCYLKCWKYALGKLYKLHSLVNPA